MNLRKVAIVGIGETKFGKHMDRSITDLAAEACIQAIKDAGVSHKKIQLATGAYACQWNGPLGQYFALPEVVLREIGITQIPMFRTENGCSTGSVAFRDVWYRIATGEYDIGLAFGMEKMNAADSSSIRSTISDHEAEDDFEQGLTAAGIYGLIANRMMYQYGVTREDIARVVVKNRKFGAMNPIAQFPTAVTLEEVLGARMIADPLTLYMCCGRGDGAAAAILMDEDTARQYEEQKAAFFRYKNELRNVVRRAIRGRNIHWCYACCPNSSWAQTLFPDRTPTKALSLLWEQTLEFCFLKREDPLDAWLSYYDGLYRKTRWLNSLGLEEIHFYNGAGTDLTVGVNPRCIWEGGLDRSRYDGTYFQCNLPSFEICTTTDRRRAKGHVAASKPLFVNGGMIQGFSFDFRNGKAVNAHAEVGE